jgi:aspartyl-tRNA(Asn)/glutamyl-tRNA(Gln) amidotransferase subunit B
VDLNRTGVPLLEIVSEPDMRSPREAAEYMKKLRDFLRWIGVCDGNMEQGSLRCDANVSVRQVGQKEYGIRTEVKNINSFKFVEKALEYEIKRQIKVLEDGGKIIQETRLWDSNRGITESMRGKEEAHDYRYFPEPDLVPIMVDQRRIDEIRSSLPELPDIKKKRFISEHGLPESDSDFLTSEKSIADWFEKAVELGGNPKLVCNWIRGEIMRLLNTDGKTMDECPLKPSHLVYLLNLIRDAKINANAAKIVLEDMYKNPDVIRGYAVLELPVLKIKAEAHVDRIIKEKGLVQVSDEVAIEKVVDDVISKNPKEVERFKAGEEKLIGFFVGQVMKLTKGKANPQMVNELLKKKLSNL